VHLHPLHRLAIYAYVLKKYSSTGEELAGTARMQAFNSLKSQRGIKTKAKD